MFILENLFDFLKENKLLVGMVIFFIGSGFFLLNALHILPISNPNTNNSVLSVQNSIKNKDSLDAPPTQTPTPTIPEPTAIPTVKKLPTTKPTSVPTNTPIPTPTNTPAPTNTPTVAPTAQPTMTQVPPSPTNTPSPTPVPSNKPSVTQ